MTIYQKAAEIIEKTITEQPDEPADWLARSILDALREKRIIPQSLRASEELFTRFHAHCRYLGDVAGPSYRYWYNKAVRHAVKLHEWPMRMMIAVVESEPGKFEIEDRLVADSTRNATTSNLMCAYGVIQDGATEHGIDLPENPQKVRTA